MKRNKSNVHYVAQHSNAAVSDEFIIYLLNNQIDLVSKTTQLLKIPVIQFQSQKGRLIRANFVW